MPNTTSPRPHGGDADIAFDRLLTAIEQRGFKITDRRGHKARARCPAHGGDDDQNLSIFSTATRVNAKCHSHGCDTKAVLEAVGLGVADRYHRPKSRDVLAVYDYGNGYEVNRTWVPPWKKGFRQKGKPEGATPLYRAEEVRRAVPEGRTIYLVEGEEDVHAAEAEGLVACTASQGAINFDKADVQPLTGGDVVAVVDGDAAGQTWATQVLASVGSVAKSLRFVRAADGCKDLSDHLTAGYGIDDLVPIDVEDGPVFEDLIPIAPPFNPQPFPTHALPIKLRTMVEQTATSLGVDPAMPAVTVLSVLSAAVGGMARVEGKPGWLEPVNLFTLVVADPSERKSPTIKKLLPPLEAAEATLAKATRQLHAERAAKKKLAVDKAERARKKAVASNTSADEEVYLALAKKADEIDVPAVTRLLCGDITSEALSALLAKQDGRMAVIASEPGVFDVIAGRYTNSANLDVWLQAWSGDRHDNDRKGDESETRISEPLLTVGLMAQPSKLEDIGRNGQFKGRGLLARFLYCRPKSLAGRRDFDSADVEEQVERDYRDAITTLAAYYHTDRKRDPEILRLAPEAQTQFRRLYGQVEEDLRPGGRFESDSLSEWAGKYAGQVLRLAGLLHLAEVGVLRGLEGQDTGLIGGATMASAIEIGAYFAEQAIGALGVMGSDPLRQDMTYVVDRIKAIDQPVVTERDILRKATRFKRMDELGPILSGLIDLGHLVVLPREGSSPQGGRPPSPRFAVHPDLIHGRGPSDTTDTTDEILGFGAERGGSVGSVGAPLRENSAGPEAPDNVTSLPELCPECGERLDRRYKTARCAPTHRAYSANRAEDAR